MAALFTGKVLMANRERDEVETEQELGRALENKVLLLYFGSGQCPRCRQFSPLLKDFFLRLTDEFYVERASQLVLVYVSRDETEEQQSAFLRSMPKRWLAVPFGDAFKRELELRFAVSEVPAVVVLRPNGERILMTGPGEASPTPSAASSTSWTRRRKRRTRRGKRKAKSLLRGSERLWLARADLAGDVPRVAVPARRLRKQQHLSVLSKSTKITLVFPEGELFYGKRALRPRTAFPVWKIG
ncbi:PREDICTED: nucleoredoxin-like protein 1 isoform X1 [Aptenodytes forsteri]|uniref:nucleoredoxin-like protein 1 isoform X1 n=1 Tax=Aptenodytes forsteri TaxID=9233 RepID=UPI0009050F0F|nr:PREDICTED: nucleoredoxin-like protein 1 isoform X1 [Aptenodytes forsteri]